MRAALGTELIRTDVDTVVNLLDWCNMYDMLRDDLKQIMENFDFNKVHSVMKLLDWKWYSEHANGMVPTIDEMKECVCDLFESGMKQQSEDFEISTGGFTLSLYNNCLSLEFILESYEIYAEDGAEPYSENI